MPQILHVVYIAARKTEAVHKRPLGRYAGVALAVGYLFFIVTALITADFKVTVSERVAGVQIKSGNENATVSCYRIERGINFVTLHIPVGRPAKQLRVLLRLDSSVDEQSHSLRLFSSEQVESKTLSCHISNRSCVDILQTQLRGPNQDHKFAATSFQYTNPLVEAASYGVAKYRLQLDGELFPVRGMSYFLTSSHWCERSERVSALASQTAPVLRASLGGPNGELFATADMLRTFRAQIESDGLQNDQLLRSPIFKALQSGACNESLERDGIHVWPSRALDEVGFLALSNTNMYHNEPHQVKLRRELVEVGLDCIAAFDPNVYQRSVNLYKLDCEAGIGLACKQRASLTFRYAASSSLVAWYDTDGSAAFMFSNDDALEALQLNSVSSTAYKRALLKLALLTLTSAVMWTRAHRSDADATSLYWRTVKYVRDVQACHSGDSAQTASDKEAFKTSAIVSDALFGLSAIAVRFTLGVVRYDWLSSDNQQRVAIVQILGSLASLTSGIIRFSPYYTGVELGNTHGNGPLARYGGSMAVIDTSCTMLLAFSEPPLLTATTERFDNTARLLVGTVLLLVSFRRCVFAMCSNALCLEAYATKRFKSNFVEVACYSTCLVLWTAQNAFCAITFVDLVIRPMIYSLHRFFPGGDFGVTVAFILASLALSLPRLLNTMVDLKRRKEAAKHV